MNRRKFWIMLALAPLAGCGGKPMPAATTVAIAIAAAPDVNPGPDGVAAPVVLRVYQLAAPGSFDNAEFFPLYNGDAAALGTDLVRRQDVALNPGQHTSITLQPGDTVTTIGLFAGLRDFQSATWHADAALVAHKANTLQVTVGRAGVAVVAGPAK